MELLQDNCKSTAFATRALRLTRSQPIFVTVIAKATAKEALSGLSQPSLHNLHNDYQICNESCQGVLCVRILDSDAYGAGCYTTAIL
jgi:hypothetical protein